MSLEQSSLCFKTGVELVEERSSGQRPAASTAVSEQPVESTRSSRKSGRKIFTRKGQDVEERRPPVYTYEPVNMAVLRDIASRRGAEKFHLKRVVRDVVGMYLQLHALC